MAMVKGRRQRTSRRQNSVVVLLTLLVAVVEAGALVAEQRRHPRRARKPIAVALVSTPQNRRPPTPEILPLPPRPVPAAHPPAPAAPGIRSGTPRKPAPRPSPRPAPTGDQPLTGPEPEKPVPTNGSEEVPPAGESEQEPEPEPPIEPEPAVPPAGGRRQCAADGPGAPFSVDTARASTVGSRFPLLLTAPFRTRPSLDPYLAEVEYLGRVGPRARGVFRIALPEQVIRFELDEPGGAALYIGRTDARCAVLAVLKGRPVTLKLRGLPVRLVDRARRVALAIVDLEMDQEANLTIVHRAGDRLPFTRARLANAGAISASVGGHLATLPGR
ncbi:MAG: hypothetical protein ABIJ09_14445 [Pseudomonadota bacterium]